MSSVARAGSSTRILLKNYTYYAAYALFVDDLSPGGGLVGWQLEYQYYSTGYISISASDFVGVGSYVSRTTQGLGPCLNGAIFGLNLPTVTQGLMPEQQAQAYFYFLAQEAQQCLTVYGYTVDFSPFMAPTLTVPQWFQGGFSYSGNNYDHEINNNVNPPVPFTIGAKGCYLTALTIVVNTWLENLTSPTNPNPPYPGYDPSVLNSWDGLYDDSSGNIVQDPLPLENIGLTRVLPNIGNASSSNVFPIINNDPIQTLDNILSNHVPVILEILGYNPKFGNNGFAGIHFVVLTGVSPEGDYYVNDPGAKYQLSGQPVKTLSDIQNTLWWAGHVNQGTTPCLSCSLGNVNNFIVFVPKVNGIASMDPNTSQALSVYTDGPVELILTDPQGRQTGFNPVSNASLQNIPVSVYSNTVYSDEQNFTPYPPALKAVYMANQMPGQYTLSVIGTGSGNFTVGVRASDAAGNWITQTYSGTTVPGISSQFTFQGAVTAFATFGATLAISLPHQAFGVSGTFTLGSGGTISLLTQPLTIQIGNAFLATIPAGSFTQTERGVFTFAGVINGIGLVAGLEPTGSNSYSFQIGGQGTPNLPSANPVDVRLAVGSNGGSTSVAATFLP